MQEWRSGQVSIVADFDFTVSFLLSFSISHLYHSFFASPYHIRPFQIQFLVTRGPESVGFVAIDDFEMFTETDALPCPFQPKEANPRPETTTASSGVRSCDFEDGLCGWEIQPPQATFTWSRTSIPELEERGELHPDRLPDGGTDG